MMRTLFQIFFTFKHHNCTEAKQEVGRLDTKSGLCASRSLKRNAADEETKTTDENELVTRRLTYPEYATNAGLEVMATLATTHQYR
jgi:hypothetical protein